MGYVNLTDIDLAVKALFLIYMQIRFERNRTSTIVIMYSLYLYFLGLSLRNTSKALTIFKDQKRNYRSYEIEYKDLVH